MTQFSNYSDINAVMHKAATLLTLIENEYQKCLYEQLIRDKLLVEIKDFLTNLRTALDYLAKKIIKKNFPIRNSQSDFDNYMIQISVECKAIFLKFQPFKGNDWIKNFNTLTNENKHVTLVPQKRIECKELKINSGGAGISLGQGASIHLGHGASITMGNMTIPGGQTISPTNPAFFIGNGTQIIVTWVSFNFDNKGISDLPENISALPFMKQCFQNIAGLIKEIEAAYPQGAL